MSLAHEKTPTDCVGYVSGSIDNQNNNGGKLVFIKVEDENMRGQGLAGRMLRGFSVVMKAHGATIVHSQMILPEALKARAKVFNDEDIHFYDHFDKRARNQDGSYQELPMSIAQALMSADRMRAERPEEDWRRIQDLGAFVNLASVDTSTWEVPIEQPWQEW